MSFGFGSADAVIDTNGRVSLPATFRTALPENEKRFILAIGKNNSLKLFRESYFNEVVAPAILKKDAKERIDASSSVQLVVLDDKQNRFLVPKKFQDHLGVDENEKKLIFVGQLESANIYTQTNYKTRNFGGYEYDE